MSLIHCIRCMRQIVADDVFCRFCGQQQAIGEATGGVGGGGNHNNGNGSAGWATAAPVNPPPPPAVAAYPAYEMTYRIVSANGQHSKPVGADRLRLWARERVVLPHSLLLNEFGETVRADSVPELRAVFPAAYVAPPAPARAAVRQTPPLQPAPPAPPARPIIVPPPPAPPAAAAVVPMPVAVPVSVPAPVEAAPFASAEAVAPSVDTDTEADIEADIEALPEETRDENFVAAPAEDIAGIGDTPAETLDEAAAVGETAADAVSDTAAYPAEADTYATDYPRDYPDYPDTLDDNFGVAANLPAETPRRKPWGVFAATVLGVLAVGGGGWFAYAALNHSDTPTTAGTVAAAKESAASGDSGSSGDGASIPIVRTPQEDFALYQKRLAEISDIYTALSRIELSKDGNEVTLYVQDAWLKESDPIRQASAQTFWKWWSEIHSPADPDKSRIYLKDSRGTQVGGSKWMGGTTFGVYVEPQRTSVGKG